MQHALFMAGNPARFVFHSKSAVAKGDFYLLGVQIRLLTRWKILDVLLHSCTVCKLFSLLVTQTLLLNVIWISSATDNRFVDYKFINLFE